VTDKKQRKGVSTLKHKDISWVPGVVDAVPEDIAEDALCALCLTIISHRTKGGRAALSAAMMLPIMLSRTLKVPSEEMAQLFHHTGEMMQGEAEKEAREQFH
jgi:hypothetical protein